MIKPAVLGEDDKGGTLCFCGHHQVQDVRQVYETRIVVTG